MNTGRRKVLFPSILSAGVLTLAFALSFHASGCASAEPPEAVPSPDAGEGVLSFRARLIGAGAGGQSFTARIDVEGRSSEEELLILYRHWGLGDFEGFLSAFREFRCGSLRFIGSSGLNIPLHAAVEKREDGRLRFLLVGEERGSVVPGYRRRSDRRTGRFLAVVLDVNAEGRGEGWIHEDAVIEFEPSTIVFVSSATEPKKLVNVERIK
jgi:hypothetical protein